MATATHRIRASDRSRHRKLEQLLSQQETTLRNRKQIMRDGLPTSTSGVTDDEEHSLDAEEQGIGFSVLELTSRTLQRIETALQRLETGNFGRCSDCRCKISDARLRALPFAALCLGCQDRQDTVGVAVGRGTAGWVEHVTSSRSRSVGH
jgi:DnaK suppressor protein